MGPKDTIVSKEAAVTAPEVPATKKAQFRVFVGSYEHNLLCLSVILGEGQPVFQPIFHFEAHSLSIKSIDLAKRYLVTGSNDEHIRIYDLQKRKELGTLLSHQGTVTTLRFSREGNDHADKSGKWLLSGSEDGKILIWRTKDWEIFGTLKGHQDKINDLAIHPSGRVAISVSKDQTVRLWNLMTVKKAAVLKLKGRDTLGQAGEYVRWTSDGNHFLVGLLNQLFIYSTTDAKILKKYKIKSTLMCLESYVLDGEEYVVTGHGNGEINFHKLSDILDESTTELQPVFTLRGHTNRIKDFVLFQNPESNNVPFLVSVSSDGKIVIWDLSKDVRDQVAVYDSGERLNCVVASPEGIEKADTMKRRYTETEPQDFTESEYETDGEEVRKILKGKNKKQKAKKSKVSITRE